MNMWLFRLIYFAVVFLALSGTVGAQDTSAAGAGQSNDSSPAQRLDKAFKDGNNLLEQHKPAEALLRYEEALAIQPDDATILFNAGMAAYFSKNFARAADLWKHLVALDPDDWRARSKLIQAYQALGKTMERDAERTKLVEAWKSGKNEDLSKQIEYCREQFEVNGSKVMAFEHFEFKGERPVRYVFIVLNTDGKEDHQYSLGSYETTNQIWHETTKPTPKKEERLFHLDGYFPNMHATYGMMVGEPSYDETRAMVVKIIQGELKPMSSTTWNPPVDSKKPEPK